MGVRRRRAPFITPPRGAASIARALEEAAMRRLRRTGWALLGGLLSLLAGAPLADAEMEAEEVEAAPLLRVVETEASGAGIEGDGFYVWDEDARSAESWAIELAGPAVPPRGPHD
jgi:hypothetical protein